MHGKSITIVAGAALSLIWAAGASAAPAASPLMAPIHQFIDSFNKGDAKAAAATHVADPVIIDEVPPHRWHGSGAFQAWSNALMNDANAKGQSDNTVTLGAPVRTEVQGDDGYAVVKATYSYKEKGKAMTEPGQMTFALHKEAAGWKITGWAWSGPAPHAAAGGAAKPKS